MLKNIAGTSGETYSKTGDILRPGFGGVVKSTGASTNSRLQAAAVSAPIVSAKADEVSRSRINDNDEKSAKAVQAEPRTEFTSSSSFLARRRGSLPEDHSKKTSILEKPMVTDNYSSALKNSPAQNSAAKLREFSQSPKSLYKNSDDNCHLYKSSESMSSSVMAAIPIPARTPSNTKSAPSSRSPACSPSTVKNIRRSVDFNSPGRINRIPYCDAELVADSVSVGIKEEVKNRVTALLSPRRYTDSPSKDSPSSPLRATLFPGSGKSRPSDDIEIDGDNEVTPAQHSAKPRGHLGDRDRQTDRDGAVCSDVDGGLENSILRDARDYEDEKKDEDNAREVYPYEHNKITQQCTEQPRMKAGRTVTATNSHSSYNAKAGPDLSSSTFTRHNLYHQPAPDQTTQASAQSQRHVRDRNTNLFATNDNIDSEINEIYEKRHSDLRAQLNAKVVPVKALALGTQRPLSTNPNIRKDSARGRESSGEQDGKKLTVPKSPRFSTMSWQKKVLRAGVNRDPTMANAPNSSAVRPQEKQPFHTSALGVQRTDTDSDSTVFERKVEASDCIGRLGVLPGSYPTRGLSASRGVRKLSVDHAEVREVSGSSDIKSYMRPRSTSAIRARVGDRIGGVKKA